MKGLRGNQEKEDGKLAWGLGFRVRVYRVPRAMGCIGSRVQGLQGVGWLV